MDINSRTLLDPDDWARGIDAVAMLTVRGIEIQRVTFAPFGNISIYVKQSPANYALPHPARFARIGQTEMWQAWFFGVQVLWCQHTTDIATEVKTPQKRKKLWHLLRLAEVSDAD